MALAQSGRHLAGPYPEYKVLGSIPIIFVRRSITSLKPTDRTSDECEMKFFPEKMSWKGEKYVYTACSSVGGVGMVGSELMDFPPALVVIYVRTAKGCSTIKRPDE